MKVLFCRKDGVIVSESLIKNGCVPNVGDEIKITLRNGNWRVFKITKRRIELVERRNDVKMTWILVIEPLEDWP